MNNKKQIEVEFQHAKRILTYPTLLGVKAESIWSHLSTHIRNDTLKERTLLSQGGYGMNEQLAKLKYRNRHEGQV